MGMKLVGMALTKWAPHVPDRAFRVLVRMAMTALDEGTEEVPPNLYFGGKDLLLAVLRGERTGTLKSLERSLERAVKDLVELGAIERTNRAFFGERACYKLTLMGPVRIDDRAVDNSGEPDTQCRVMPDTHSRAMPDTQCRESPTPTVGPMSNEEVLEEQLEDESVDLTEPVAVTRATGAEQNTELISSACRDPTCQMGYLYDRTKPKGQRNIPCPICRPAAKVIPFQRKAKA